jgi:uncharacterized LabA/DUF88 family protein
MVADLKTCLAHCYSWFYTLSGTSQVPERLMIFVDGQNLIYACQQFAAAQGPNCRFFYNEEQLEQCLISMQSNRRHVQTRFYTAIASPDPARGKSDAERFERQWKRQEVLKKKLKWEVFSKKSKAYPFFCPYCRWKGLQTPVVCQKCGNELKELKNKGVDVALAVDLLMYGMSDMTSSYDVAILVSGDNDFVPVIEKLKDRRPQVKVEIAQFENAVGFDMKRVSDKFYPLDNIADKIGKLKKFV